MPSGGPESGAAELAGGSCDGGGGCGVCGCDGSGGGLSERSDADGGSRGWTDGDATAAPTAADEEEMDEELEEGSDMPAAARRCSTRPPGLRRSDPARGVWPSMHR